MAFIGFTFPERSHSESKQRRIEWKNRMQLHTRATANPIIKVYIDIIKAYVQKTNKTLHQNKVTIKAMQNEMTARNTFQQVPINISILQRRRWGVWRVEVSSNCVLFFPNQKTLFMSCILSGLSPPECWATTGLRKLQDTWWLSAPCRTKIYYCIVFMNTNTSFSNQWTNTKDFWVRCTTCRLWKLNVTQSQLNDSYQFPWDWDQAFMCFWKRPDWQPWRP